jgi:predicted regulator of amino acid metabolism with ACT domain
MWKTILIKYFKKYPAQQKVAQTILSYGLKIQDGKIFCGGIELSFSKIARALSVDRRAVVSTVETIEDTKELKKIFSSLNPTCDFSELASKMKWGVVEIIPTDASMPGILAGVAQIVMNEDISIRQANVEDYVIAEEPKLIIITEKSLPSRLIKRLSKSKGVKGVTLY